MRPQGSRGSRGKRRAIGAAAITGVLLIGGGATVQFADASTRSNLDVVSVNGERFDISDCDDVEINDDNVICDDELLAPIGADAAEAAELAADALSASCDAFVSALLVAQEDGALEEDDAERETKAAATKVTTKSDDDDAEQVLLESCLALGDAKGLVEVGDVDDEDDEDEDDEEMVDDGK
jgi:hypothetical protein